MRRPTVQSALLITLVLPACSTPPPSGTGQAARTVTGYVQVKPGGPRREARIKVHESPTNLKLVAAEEASLREDELILGVPLDGRAVAYPIRYLALYEIVDDEIGRTPLTPSW